MPRLALSNNHSLTHSLTKLYHGCQFFLLGETGENDLPADSQ